MNYSSITRKTVMVLTVFFLSLSLQAGEIQTNWQAYSTNLVKAIKKGNPGLQQSAMQRVIQYGGNLDVSDAAYEIGRIFGYNQSPVVRRLAMIALHKINTDKSMYYLQKYLPLETNESVKKQANSILYDYVAANDMTLDDLKLAAAAN